MDEKILEKARQAKTPEELIALAKEKGVELTETDAKTYFEKLNTKGGELADDELDNVAGGRKCGTMYFMDRPIVTACNSCELYEDEVTRSTELRGMCGSCYYSKTLDIFLVCNCPSRRNN